MCLTFGFRSLPEAHPSSVAKRRQTASPRLAKLPSWNRRGSRERLSLIASGGVVAHTPSAGVLCGRLSVSDHPGASRHPSCARRGASLPTRFPLITRTGSSAWGWQTVAAPRLNSDSLRAGILLFLTQCVDGVDTHGAPGWYVTGNHGQRPQKNRRAEQEQGIGGAGLGDISHRVEP